MYNTRRTCEAAAAVGCEALRIGSGPASSNNNWRLLTSVLRQNQGFVDDVANAGTVDFVLRRRVGIEAVGIKYFQAADERTGRKCDCDALLNDFRAIQGDWSGVLLLEAGTEERHAGD